MSLAGTVTTETDEGQGATIHLPYPPSTNRLWRVVNGRPVLSKEGRGWKSEAYWAVKKAGLRDPISGDVAVVVTLHPKRTKGGKASRRRIDLDNALKAVLDALNKLAYEDDAQVVQLAAHVGGPLKGGGLTVTVGRALDVDWG